VKFGFMHIPRSLEETRSVAALGDSFGFDWITVPDSPLLYQDSYLHQLEVARAAPHVLVGPMVSHVVLRHPIIVANLLATMQEFTGGRVTAALSTASSAARGVGLPPATIRDLGAAVTMIRSYWGGDGGTYKGTRLPATGVQRPSCPILISADGPKAAALAGEVGDGLLYGGTMDPEVRRRRLVSAQIGNSGRQAWIAPTLSLGTTHQEVRDNLGVHLVAMANRSMRHDLDERNVPHDLHEDVVAMRRSYDFGRADNTKPASTALTASDRLLSYAIDSLCIWGDETRFTATIDALAAEGWNGVMFILGQADQYSVVRALGERLCRLGYLGSATEHSRSV
jgi:5,10-methylenetetrahydromethanopterin reductase